MKTGDESIMKQAEGKSGPYLIKPTNGYINYEEVLH